MQHHLLENMLHIHVRVMSLACHFKREKKPLKGYAHMNKTSRRDIVSTIYYSLILFYA